MRQKRRGGAKDGVKTMTMVARSSVPFVDHVSQLESLTPYRYKHNRPIPNAVFMCSPDYFEVAYVINPHMEGKVGCGDRSTAIARWDEYYGKLRRQGRTIHLLQTVPKGFPDICFTANAGVTIVDTRGRRWFVPAVPKHVERQGEISYFTESVSRIGYTPFELDGKHSFEGYADFMRLPHSDVYMAFYGIRTERDVLEEIHDRFQLPVVALKLKDEHFFHGDVPCTPLRYDTIMFYPGAFAPESVEFINAYFPRKIILNREEALAFAGNAAAFEDGNVMMTPHAPDAARQITDMGLFVDPTDLDPFLSAGGYAACLRMPLEGM